MKNTSTKQKITLVLLGLFLCVILLEVGLRLGGFVLSSLQEHRNATAIEQKGAYRIMCLGESTSAGGEDSYPSQLQVVLNQQEIRINFSVINKGRPGADTSIIISQLEANLNKYNPDAVVTMMGINDTGNTIAYEDFSAKRTILFLNSFRTYKLLRLLGLHIVNKAKEAGIYYPKENIMPQIDDLAALSIYNNQEQPVKQIKEIDCNNHRAYIKLGIRYKRQGNYSKAREMFQKAVQLSPKNDQAYVELGWWYRDQEDYNKAKEMFDKALKINPRNYRAYEGIGWCYRDQGDYIKTEEIFQDTLKVNPKSYKAHYELGWWLKGRREYKKAEEVFRKATKIDPANYKAYIELGWCLRDQGKYAKAEEVFQKALKVVHEKAIVCGALAQLYREQGNSRSAEVYFRKAHRLRLGYYNPITQHNYRKLKEIVTQRGIKLVCVQYPIRSIEPLRKMLQLHSGIIFVDNEKVFKKALKQGSYDEYFTDMFGGDFGHCTAKGNRLLAENIANVILQNIQVGPRSRQKE